MTTLEGTPNPEAPNPQLPIVQKLRIRYAKRGRLRFTSHRDFARAFERAVRRAAIPIGFSSGFTPHPKISYANASPTGAASEAEYLEIGMTRPCDPDQVREALDSALPDGIDIVEVVVAKPGALADRLQGSSWEIALPGVTAEHAQSAVDGFLAAEEVLIERMMKRGLRTLDCRAAVLGLSVRSDETPMGPCAILAVVVRHDTPSIRPDDVLAGLRSSGGLELEQTPIATRLAQGPLDTELGTVGDPLAFDRDAS
ncbi:MAG: radical protein [Aeromicrobium sp.]|uniref:TIGR03936 family radical SAM-associated protein n=1 Tax=Aeromicrobium sp. TaxID=1871063 RepID=UPI00261342C3|nr:TIGR03936 family radical SAM-associated protein [Aeromicrobium sp.]MCW2824488.1 radical protein [Aeromicrobium sp.]